MKVRIEHRRLLLSSRRTAADLHRRLALVLLRSLLSRWGELHVSKYVFLTSHVPPSTAVPPSVTAEGKKKVVWRTDLQATKRHWRGWFEGMSAAFLELSVPKVGELHILLSTG